MDKIKKSHLVMGEIPELKFKINEKIASSLKESLAGKLKKSYCEEDLYFEKLRNDKPSYTYYTMGASLMIRKHGRQHILVYKEPRMLARGIIKVREEVRVHFSSKNRMRGLLTRLGVRPPKYISFESVLEALSKSYKPMGYVIKERDVYVPSEDMKVMIDRLVFTDSLFHKFKYNNPLQVMEIRGQIDKIYAMKEKLNIKDNILVKNNYRLLIEAGLHDNT